MMIVLRYVCVGFVALTAGGLLAENLFPRGDFTDAKPTLAGDCEANGGRLSLFTENGNWNRCGKLEITRAYTNESGHVTMNASGWVGCENGKYGLPVKPDTEYRFSVELRGESSDVRIDCIRWKGPHTWKDMSTKPTSVGLVKMPTTWRQYRGTFRTGSDTKRAALVLQLASSTNYGPLRHKVGDYVLFDNVIIEEAPKRDLKALAVSSGSPYRISCVKPTDSMLLPFLPEGLFATNEVTAFHLVAAQNEVKALPVAIANLTGETASYRVTIESKRAAEDRMRDPAYRYLGKKGLAGFPEEQVTCRYAIAAKDDDGEGAGRMLDALPKMDESYTISVPPYAARLVWFDFDTTDVPVGKYEGYLRVIPLMECGEWKSTGGFDNRVFIGKMRDWPVSLEVTPMVLAKEPVLPCGFFEGAVNRPMFEAMLSAGMRESGISPYDFPFGRRKVDLPQVRTQLNWAKEKGIHLKWFIGFSAYRSLSDVLAVKEYPTPAEHTGAFVAWLRQVKSAMNALGIADEDYGIETWDEPEVKYLDEMFAVHTRIKRELPTVRLYLTLGAQGMGLAGMEKMAPVTDGWILWDYGYFGRKDFLDFIARQRQAGKHVSHYTCSTHTSMLRGDRYRGYRLRPWLAWRNDLTGHNLFLFSDPAGGYGASDWKVAMWGGMAYRSFDMFIPSVRQMCYREGLTDLQYLSALKTKCGNVAETAAFLKTAATIVYDENPHDDTCADRIRARARELYLNAQR